MNVTKPDSRSHKEDTVLEVDDIETGIHRNIKNIDLVLESGSQTQIDIALDQGSPYQNSCDHKNETDLEIAGIDQDESSTSTTLGSDRDFPGNQSKTIEVLFDDEIMTLNSEHRNSEYRNSIEQFQLGETSPPGNVRTWVPRLASKCCMQLAKRGHRGAQYRLGCMYALGSGVNQNHVMAYTWCKISAMQHSPKAPLKLREIESSLTSAHIDYARSLSGRYYNMYVEPFSSNSQR